VDLGPFEKKLKMKKRKKSLRSGKEKVDAYYVVRFSK
jgi:hypothetical protein